MKEANLSNLTPWSTHWQKYHSFGRWSKNFKERNSELMRNRRYTQQYLTEDKGASVEVLLKPFDESGSNTEDMDEKFKCICGKIGSLNKLKKHKNSHSCCSTNRMSQSNSASQRGFLNKINLNLKPKTLIEKSF